MPELMDRIEFEAALLALELEAKGRTAVRSTVHPQTSTTQGQRITYRSGQRHT